MILEVFLFIYFKRRFNFLRNQHLPDKSHNVLNNLINSIIYSATTRWKNNGCGFLPDNFQAVKMQIFLNYEPEKFIIHGYLLKTVSCIITNQNQLLLSKSDYDYHSTL